MLVAVSEVNKVICFDCQNLFHQLFLAMLLLGSSIAELPNKDLMATWFYGNCAYAR
jgi:hypothetical protein